MSPSTCSSHNVIADIWASERKLEWSWRFVKSPTFAEVVIAYYQWCFFSGWTEKVKVKKWKCISEHEKVKVKKWKWKKWEWTVKKWLWKGEHHILSASHAWDSCWPARVRSITQREPSFHLPRSFINLSGLWRIKFTHKSLIRHFPSIDEVFHLQGGKFCSSTFQMTNFHPAAVKVKSKAHSRPS